MKWTSLEVFDDEGNTVGGHVLPCDDDNECLTWHTTSALCGCNPRRDVNVNGVPIYLHFESETSQEGQNDGDSP